ncbi:MAG: hypothetical protein ACKOQ3_14275 [Novosphingobium sp.]
MRTPLLTALILGLATASAAPASGAPLGADWPVVAAASDGDCALEVTGNGKIFLIAATGLGAGTAGRYRISNGDMVPIDWTITATGGGRLARYYLPFRWGHAGERIEGGRVEVSIATADCSVRAAFPWKRGIRVID